MSKKKGLSVDEKRQRALDFFYSKKEVFNLKELEKWLPKEKGIIVQSIKDIIKSLEDDNLIDSDKIGSSTYYWAFPSKRFELKKAELKNLEKKIEDNNKRLEEVNQNLNSFKLSEEEKKEREEKLNLIQNLTSERDELKIKLNKYKDDDPIVLSEMKSEIKQAKVSLNLWTDNVLAVRSFCKNRFNLEESQFNERFEITDEFDYVDDH
jgi:meiotic nuclear division protein 1 homolog